MQKRNKTVFMKLIIFKKITNLKTWSLTVLCSDETQEYMRTIWYDMTKKNFWKNKQNILIFACEKFGIEIAWLSSLNKKVINMMVDVPSGNLTSNY